VRGKPWRRLVVRGREQVFSIDAATGLFRPTFAGWNLLGERYRVLIDDFIPQGDILAPGVTGADDRIREGDEVLVVGKRAVATGRAAMGADEMCRSSRGVAVKVRKVRKLPPE
jgi:archaeosine synthase